MGLSFLFSSQPTRPWGLKWRSSVWFITIGSSFSLPCPRLTYHHTSRRSRFVVSRSSLLFPHTLSGITTDLLVYSIIIPVMPFQLEHLQFHSISALTGWLLCAYVRVSAPFLLSLTHPLQSLGLVLCASSPPLSVPPSSSLSYDPYCSLCGKEFL